MKKLIPERNRVAIGAALLLLAFLTGCGSPRPVPAITIGNIAPRTGPQRELGLHAEEAIRLAIDEVKAPDSVLPGRTVEVRHADSEGNPETAQTVAVRLLSINRAVALIGSDDPASADRLCKIAQQYKVPVIVPVWLPSPTLGSYGFALAPTPAEQGKALAEFAAAQLKPNRIAVLVDSRSPANVARAASFIETVGKGATIRRDEFTTDEQLKGLVKSSLGAEPQAICFAGNADDLEKLWAGEGAKSPSTVPILYAGDDNSRLTSLSDRQSGTSIYWTTPFLAEEAPATAKGFIQKYQEQYKRPPDAEAAFAYDAVRLLLEAMRQAKTARPDRVRDELAKIKDFPSLTGPISFDSSQIARRPVLVVTRQNQQWKAFRPSQPPAADKAEPKAPAGP